jgi:small subunit ribosomal protein S2
MAVVTMKELLEAGVHFGHQTRRWNPKMKPYIFTERNDIYIIDLQKTLVMTGASYNAVRNSVGAGGSVLFVGTKKQSQEAVQEHALRCGMPYVNHRWLGGTLTNFTTIHSRVMHLEELERRDTEGELDQLPKKEALQLRRQVEKLKRNLEGIRTMHKLPSLIFVLDPRKERIAVAEGRKLGIPIVGLVDTNCDPDEVDFIIPGNDDAIRAANLLCRVIADAVIEGQGMMDARLAEETAEKQEAARERLEKSPTRIGAAVPAFSASPDDIAGPDMTPVYSGEPTVEGADEDVKKAVEETVGVTETVEAAEAQEALEAGGEEPAAEVEAAPDATKTKAETE